MTPIACMAGTYSASDGNRNSTACLPCEPGLMCPDAATTVPVVPCPAGFYCPAGTTLFALAKGHAKWLPNECGIHLRLSAPQHMSINPSQKLLSGFVSRANLATKMLSTKITSDTNMRRGWPHSDPYFWFSMTVRHTGTAEATLQCGAGQACVVSSWEPTDCPAGTFQPSTGQDSCLPCPEG